MTVDVIESGSAGEAPALLRTGAACGNAHCHTLGDVSLSAVGYLIPFRNKAAS